MAGKLTTDKYSVVEPELSYATNLKFDESLRLSDENFHEKLKNGTKFERRSKEERLDSVIAYPEPLDFARFADAAYQDWEEDENQWEYEQRLQLPPGWRLLTTARGLDNYFGAAYWQPAHRRVVVAHRGIVPTSLNVLLTCVDGIYSHKHIKQMDAACSFAEKIRDAVEKVELERQTTFEIFFTGHSLGAWLAQVTTFSLKYLTLVEGAFVKNVTDDGYHARTVVFDSPGCEDTIGKMIRDLDVRYAGKSMDAFSLDITGYLSSPNFVNCCNRHVGKLYRVYPKINSKDYVKYTLSSHSMMGILETFENSLPIKEIVDWPQIQINPWQWKIWELSDNILGKEYRDFFQFATDLNHYDPSVEEIRRENKERFVRYETKVARTNECASNVFTDSELEFIRQFQQLKIIQNSLFEGEEMSDEYRSQIAENLNHLIINTEDRTIRSRDEDQFKLFRLIPYVKTLLRLYPDLKERTRLALTYFEVRKPIYADYTEKYRREMEYLTNSFLPYDWPDFDHFLKNGSTVDCHILAECGTDSVMAKVLKVTETEDKDFTVLAFEWPNVVTTETFFHLTEFLKSQFLRDGLLLIAIECEVGTFRNRQNLQLVQKLREEIRNGRSNAKLVVITDPEDEFHLDGDWVRLSHGGVTWDELTNEAKTEILSKNVITFQGNPQKISLQNWTTNLGDFAEILDPKTLMKFLKGEDVFVGPKMPSLEDFYIPREFKYNPYVKEEIFDNAGHDDVVAVWANDQRSFSTISTKFEDHWKSNRLQIITSDEDFSMLIEKNPRKNIHCLKMEWNLLVWCKTEGSLNLIRRNINDSWPQIVLDNLEDIASKTLIISDEPGMGKSTVLTVLAQKLKERNPNHWVIRINLNDCAKAFYDANKNNVKLNNPSNAAEFLSGQILPRSGNTNLKSAFERKLFEKSITSSGGMVLILDAFDEISPDYEEIVLKLVKILSESCLEKLVLSTRPHTKEQLEDQLGTLSYTMAPFSRNDRKEFLIQFWKSRFNEVRIGQIDLHELADQCVDQLEKSICTEEGDFLGIPLQCQLLAEYTLEEIIEGENQPKLREISLMELYEAFVWRKMDIYQSEKYSKMDGNIMVRNQQVLMRQMMMKAHRQYALRLLLPREKWDEMDYREIEDNRDLIEIGVLKAGLMLKTGDNPQFVHRTFAEFFVFEYILELARIRTKDLSLKLTILSREVLSQPEFGVARTFLDGLIRYEKRKDETTAILRSFALIVAQNWTVDKTILLNRRGNTVLHELLRGKNFFVMDALLEMLTDVCGPEMVKYLIETPDPRCLFPLHIAAAIGHLGITRLFLEMGADIDDCTDEGATPLHVASRNDHLEIAHFFLEKGANLNACTNEGMTPLYVATQNGHLEITRLLLEKGANLNYCTDEGMTPLYVASQNGHLEITRLLIEKGANLYYCTNEGATPLHVASQNGHLEIARLLIEKGANLYDCTNEGMTPLYVASQNGHLEIARLLMEKGANLNACTNQGATPLYVASQNGHLDIARLLMEKGADTDARNNIGMTSLYLGHSRLAGELSSNLERLRIKDRVMEDVKNEMSIIQIEDAKESPRIGAQSFNVNQSQLEDFEARGSKEIVHGRNPLLVESELQTIPSSEGAGLVEETVADLVQETSAELLEIIDGFRETYKRLEIELELTKDRLEESLKTVKEDSRSEEIHELQERLLQLSMTKMELTALIGDLEKRLSKSEETAGESKVAADPPTNRPIAERMEFESRTQDRECEEIGTEYSNAASEFDEVSENIAGFRQIFNQVETELGLAKDRLEDSSRRPDGEEIHQAQERLLELSMAKIELTSLIAELEMRASE